MKILITGGNGYIGKELADKLKAQYTVFKTTRIDLDLMDNYQVDNYFRSNTFDAVIHCAVSGGSRLKVDDSGVLDQNLIMYYNLLRNKSSFKKFIHLGSGAEFYNQNQPYGLSKHVINNSIIDKEGFFNLRIFGVFNENEVSTRFIKSNIMNYLTGKDIVVLDDKWMDFIYMDDFISIINNYIQSDDLPKTLDCVYANSYKLSEIAQKINALDIRKVNIQVLNNSTKRYTGNFTSIGIDYYGLDHGINNVYLRLKRNMNL
jgi:nucleoside-diphosphate-sugar epimerase